MRYFTFILLAALSMGTATAQTIEADIDGLSCSLCSEEMKTELKAAANAQKIVPRLDCGKIFFDVPKGKSLNKERLRAALLNKGYTLTGIKGLNLSVDAAGAQKC